MRTMTMEEMHQVAGGVATTSVMNAIGRTLQEQSLESQKEKARVTEGDGILPWTPPTPTPCGGEHHICRPVI